jgi:hypothetical protein
VVGGFGTLVAEALGLRPQAASTWGRCVRSYE